MFKGVEHMFKDCELVFIVREQKIYNVVRKNLPSQNYFSQAFEEKNYGIKNLPLARAKGRNLSEFIKFYTLLNDTTYSVEDPITLLDDNMTCLQVLTVSLHTVSLYTFDTCDYGYKCTILNLDIKINIIDSNT